MKKRLKDVIDTKYFRKNMRETSVKDWMDNRGNGYDTKFQAQVASFMNFIGAGFTVGFPIVISKFWYTAIAIYPFVFIRRDSISSQRLNHERIHIKQQAELLIVFAYLWYFVELWIRAFANLSLRTAYAKHSMERECRENEKNANYLLTRKKFAFIKYLK